MIFRGKEVDWRFILAWIWLCIGLLIVGVAIFSMQREEVKHHEKVKKRNTTSLHKSNHFDYCNLSQYVEQSKPIPQKKVEYLGEFEISAYCACKKCTGKSPGDKGYKVTKSTKPTIEGVTIAADPTIIPIGTIIEIDGVGEREVMDVGGDIKGNKIDVYFESHKDALNFGRRFNVKVDKILQ